jgi:hypothetical protein
MPPLRIAALITCCWLGSAMAGTAADAKAPADSAALLREIETEIGDAACDADAQCHTIAVGAKACGGPEAYLAWSDKRSRQALLADLAARHSAARALENARSRVMSNCALLPDPGATCRPRAADGGRACQPRTGSDPR